MQAIKPIETERHELNNLAPWHVARTEPNREGKAVWWLEHVGFECFYPKSKVVRFVPRKAISSNTRHRRRFETYEQIAPAYRGYIFFRYMFGRFDAWRLFELPYVIGVCTIAGHLALVPDYLVERIRLEEERGKLDIMAAGQTRQYFLLPKRREVHRYADDDRLLHRLAAEGRIIEWVERFGRVMRVITTTSPL